MITPAELRQARLRQKLSVDEVAQRAGYSRGTVQRLEKGEAVRWQALVDVARALGVSADVLVGQLSRATQDHECVAC